MVKSRRSASSSGVPKRLSRMTRPSFTVMVLPCWASSGVVGMGARKVEVSMVSFLKITWARRKRRPMMRQFLKRRRICSGVASVATSKSLGWRLSIKSRTAPPAR